MGLTRADWIEAALEALATQGLPAVAVEPLARRLGTTKGSFYWHFSDRSDLIGATLQHWEQRDTDDLISRIEEIEDPRARLASLLRSATGASASGQDAGVKLLAVATDPRVAPVLDRVTGKRLTFLTRLYRELGLSEHESVRRGRLAYALYLGTGDLHQLLPADRSESERAAYLDMAERLLVGNL